MPKLIKLVGPSSTLAEELSPFNTRSVAEVPSVRLRVFVSGSTYLLPWRDVAAELHAPSLLSADLSL